MRKFRIEARKPERKTIKLFKTADELYYWTLQAYEDPTIVNDTVDTIELILQNNDFLEVEWYGAEWIFETSDYTHCLNLVKVAHAKKTKNDSGYTIEGHTGWVSDGLLPIRNYQDNLMIIKNISEFESKLDIDKACGNEAW